jgi:hypothetical protein
MEERKGWREDGRKEGKGSGKEVGRQHISVILHKTTHPSD